MPFCIMKQEEKYNLTDLLISHKDKIYNLSYKMTGDKEVAKDITQETFLKCYENIDKFRGDSKVSTWIYTVVKNTCLQHLKNEKRIKTDDLRKLQESAFDNSIEHLNTSEKNNYINQVKEGCLLGLLRTLSINQRLAFILSILHGHSVERTSQILGKSESATRTLIHRSRKNIKEFVCNNCFHYDSQNPCKCEAMINFSLKKGWIRYDEKYSVDLPLTIKSELSEIQKISILYKSLQNHEIPSSAFSELKKNNYLIFSDKKVK